MPVRRRTYFEEVEEIGNSPSAEQKTAPPASLIPDEGFLPDSQRPTGIPSEQNNYDDGIRSERAASHPILDGRERIGKTWPDVTAPFYGQPQFVPVILTAFSFIISIGQFHTIRDLWRPLCISAILNIIWYGVRFVHGLIKHDRA